MGLLKFSTLALFLGLTACGDKTLNDHQQKELEKNISELKQVEGVYTGLVYSSTRNEVTGALALDIRVETRSSGSADRNTGRAVLVTEIKFVDTQRISIVSDNGYYDPRSQQYQSNVVITDTGRNSEELSIGAVLKSEILAGTISITGYKDYGFNFQLQKNGPPPEVLARQNLPQESEEGDSYTYSRRFKGQTVFRSGKISPINIVVTQDSLSSAADFLNKFLPVRSVSFDINYSNSTTLTHRNARWDLRNGILTAISHSGNNYLSTECKTSGSPNSPTLNWSCTHSSSSQGLTASSVAVPENDDSVEFERDDFAENAVPVRNVFSGTARYDRNGSKQTSSSLILTLPALTRAQQINEEFFPPREKLLYATIRLMSDVSLSFPADVTRWDPSTGRLNGSTEANYSGERVFMTIECSGFYMNQTKAPFQCEYTNSKLLYPFVITYQP